MYYVLKNRALIVRAGVISTVTFLFLADFSGCILPVAGQQYHRNNGAP